MKNIFIIILNFNGYKDITACLTSLHHFRNNKYSLNTLIVDNGSGTDELTNLKQFLANNKKKLSFLKLKLIENNKNLGFAKGNNVGLRYALEKGVDYVLLLNNDVILEMNFLANALKIKADIISPVVKFREFKDKPQLLYDLGGFVNWTTGRTTHLNTYKNEYLRYKGQKPISVDYVAGCCMLIKRQVLESIGFLDEKYFIYFEDVDYCITAKKHGFKVVVDPDSIIYHKLGGSMDRWSNRAIFHNLYSNFIFISKHLGIKKLTGYGYLSVLILKILKDRIMDSLTKSRIDILDNKKWRGARHNKPS